MIPHRCRSFPFRAAFLVLLAVTGAVPAVFGQAMPRLALRPVPGQTYRFEIQETVRTEIISSDLSRTAENTRRETIAFLAVGKQGNLIIADMLGEGWQRRRYFRADGSLAGSPGEDPNELPFYLAFPAGPLEKGKKVTQESFMSLRDKRYPVTGEVIVDAVNPDQQEVVLKMTATVQLPISKSLGRKLAMTGMVTFDILTGLPKQGTFTTSYRLAVANKELAVIRTAWKYSETRTITIKALGGS